MLASLALFATACGDRRRQRPAAATTAAPRTASGPSTINVPADYPTIQEAVDAAAAGRPGPDRAGHLQRGRHVTTETSPSAAWTATTVILDGEFELDNGINVLEADGVAVENMTAELHRQRLLLDRRHGLPGSYLTAFRNGDYGIYAFDSVDGQFDHSLRLGQPRRRLLHRPVLPVRRRDRRRHLRVQRPRLLRHQLRWRPLIINSMFRNNRAGIVPNSGLATSCATRTANHRRRQHRLRNNETDTPAIDVALLAQGNGILVAGGVQNVVERNRVYDHDRTGIGLVPFPEEDANDLAARPVRVGRPLRGAPRRGGPADRRGGLQGRRGPARGCVVIWNPSTTASSATSSRAPASPTSPSAPPTRSAPARPPTRCATASRTTRSAPPRRPTWRHWRPCDGTGNGGDWNAGALDLIGLLGSPARRRRRTPTRPRPSRADSRTCPTPPRRRHARPRT